LLGSRGEKEMDNQPINLQLTEAEIVITLHELTKNWVELDNQSTILNVIDKLKEALRGATK